MRGLNKVMLIGNLGKDPVVQNLENGNTVAKFTLATSETYKDQSGTKHTATEWHNVITWKSLAAVVGNYLKKGSTVYVEGKIKTRNYEDKDGKMIYTTEIIADSIVMLDRPLPTDKADINDIKQQNIR